MFSCLCVHAFARLCMRQYFIQPFFSDTLSLIDVYTSYHTFIFTFCSVLICILLLWFCCTELRLDFYRLCLNNY